MIKVFIAVPNSGAIVPDLVSNLLHWTNNPHVGAIALPEGWQPLSVARNRIVKMFMDTDCTHLWWIDCDVVPPLDALDRLLEAQKDAVSGACFCMKEDNGKYFPYPTTFMEEGGEYKIVYGKGLAEVDAVGGGCLLVRRKVYEKLGEEPYEFISLDGGTRVLTCDFNVWRKAKQAGFTLYCDYDILCDHQRKCSIKGVQDLMVGLVADG